MNFVQWLKAQGDRVVGWAGIAIGGALIVAGWIATSGTRAVSDQIPYLVSAGLGGLFFVAVGVALLIRSDLHDEWSKLDAVEQALRERRPVQGSVVELRDGPSPAARTTQAVARASRRTEPVLAVSVPADGGAAGLVATRLEATSIVVALAGALVLLWGWLTVSGTRNVPAAFNDSALGVAGLAVAAGAVGLHSFGLRRQVTHRRTQLLAGLGPASGATVADTAPSQAGDRRLYVVDGSTRYHRPGCQVLATQRPAAVHPAVTTVGLTACRLCEASASDA